MLSVGNINMGRSICSRNWPIVVLEVDFANITYIRGVIDK